MPRRMLVGLLTLLLGACAAPAQPAATLGHPIVADSPTPSRLASLPLTERDENPSTPTITPRAPKIRLASHSVDSSAAELVLTSFTPPPFTPPELGTIPTFTPPDDREDLLTGRPKRRLPDRDLYTANFGEQFASFGDRVKGQLQEWFLPGRNRETDVRRWFLSDHEFDYFASPVSNPFLFEDPRSLTEVRPIFIFQSIPNNAPSFAGGHIEFYGTRLSLAITERFSFVMNKLGFIDINPGAGATEPGGFGFAEVHLGPKFTFIRNKKACLLGAAGLIFQIPSGPERVYQDTGRLSMVPYVTFAKNFLGNRFGSFNLMNTSGYSFSGDGQRSDFFYNSFHIDWDVANRDRWYPLLELHYFQYTSSGGARDLDVEGRDLANIGDINSGGRANLSIAPGVRYKFSERAQVGFAAEFPLNRRRDLQQFRITLDLILRY